MKKIIWLLVFLVLASLAFAAKEDLINEVNAVYPNLISGDAIQSLTESETATLVKYVKEKPTAILAEEKTIEIKSEAAWREDLNNQKPAGYKNKLADIDNHFNKYVQQFGLTAEETAKLNQLTPEEKAYLVATLGRSRDQSVMIVYWMLRHPQFNYILFHENFHTYTTNKIGMLAQVALEEESLPGADESSKAEMQKIIDYQKQKALFITLWLLHVGGPKDVFFSNYGQTSLVEALPEYFARTYAGYFADDLSKFDKVNDAEQIKRYIAAFAISDCFGLFETFDGKKGLEVKNGILSVINSDASKKSIYDEVKAKILAETTCPPVAAVPVTYSGKRKLCQYSAESQRMSTSGCETVEVSELQITPSDQQESVVKAYGPNGKLIGLSSADLGYYEDTNYLTGWNVEPTVQFVPYGKPVDIYVDERATSFTVETPIKQFNQIISAGTGGAAAVEVAELAELPAESQSKIDAIESKVGSVQVIGDACLSVSDEAVFIPGSMLQTQSAEEIVEQVEALKEMKERSDESIADNQDKLKELAGRYSDGEDVSVEVNEIVLPEKSWFWDIFT